MNPMILRGGGKEEPSPPDTMEHVFEWWEREPLNVLPRDLWDLTGDQASYLLKRLGLDPQGHIEDQRWSLIEHRLQGIRATGVYAEYDAAAAPEAPLPRGASAPDDGLTSPTVAETPDSVVGDEFPVQRAVDTEITESKRAASLYGSSEAVAMTSGVFCTTETTVTYTTAMRVSARICRPPDSIPIPPPHLCPTIPCRHLGLPRDPVATQSRVIAREPSYRTVPSNCEDELGSDPEYQVAPGVLGRVPSPHCTEVDFDPETTDLPPLPPDIKVAHDTAGTISDGSEACEPTLSKRAGTSVVEGEKPRPTTVRGEDKRGPEPLDQAAPWIQGPTGSIAKYLAEHRALARACLYPESHPRVLDVAYQNLPLPYREAFRREDFTTWTQLEELGKRVGEARAVTACQAPSNIPETSPSPGYQPVLRNTVPPTLTPRDTRPAARTASPTRTGCWNCQERGHVYALCPLPRSRFCYRCGNPGAITTNCTHCSRLVPEPAAYRRVTQPYPPTDPSRWKEGSSLGPSPGFIAPFSGGSYIPCYG